MNKIFRKIISAIAIAVLSVSTTGLYVELVYAAALTSMSDTLSSAKVSTASNHNITFTTPTGITSGQTVSVTFPGTFVVHTSLTFTDLDISDDGTPLTLAAAPSGATWGAVRTSATVITFTNGTTAVAAGSVVNIKIGTNATNQTTGVFNVTNGSATGQNVIAIGGTMADSGSINIVLVTDDTVAISATVAQSITFAISSNTIAFGTLDSAAARYANTTTGSAADTTAHTLAVGTNAPSGYTITVFGQTLTSGANTITAIGATPVTSSVGTEQFGIYATKAGGINGVIAAPYATASSFGYNATSTAATFASGSSSTATETYSLHYLANIASNTEAGSYTTNINYVATANF